MTTHGNGRGNCWPTEDQVLLLRAGLLREDKARAAWLRWRANNDPQTTDRGSVRLLPLVYRNLPAGTLADADATALKSSYQAAWYRNQLRLKSVADALAVLHEQGIRTMLLKGAALVVAHYGDAGVRPMDDVDVLVPWEEARRALAVLTAGGWRSEREDFAVSGLATGHAEHLRDPDGGNLDLHRAALVPASPDGPFWDASLEIEVLGTPTRTLCAADQLLHVAVHGARWNVIPPVRWMADAVAVARSQREGLDWERVVAEATRRRLTLIVAAALERLTEAVAFEVPAEVLERLRAVRKTPLERLTFRAATTPLGGGNAAPLVFDHYRRLSRLDPSLRLSDVLRDSFGARTRREVARHVARKTADVVTVQSARVAAPGRLRSCASCGRRTATLRPAEPVFCWRCAQSVP
jgi:Uncharacterised nucleotidyltransferase